MDLTVIIVNYNVRYYLEQCISSVAKAIAGIDAEVFVVDNDSSDGSIEMVAEKFPWVKLIANKDNVGFSKANNQALEQAKGRYSLLLNPDTLVAEDAFELVIDFMDRTPDAGGVGVRMVDGKGHFLPESKRGLPTPMVAFFKIAGLSRLFPNSSLFGKYHLGHLPEKEVSEIEILSGACMFLRTTTLDKVGLLDNSFFMYGEDIDLSYRITLGGYKNYYFPDAEIIHYKGESTKKSSFNYVYVFYNAMTIFARKHFTNTRSGLFTRLIDLAIYTSAGAALLARTFQRLILPIADMVVVLAGTLLIEGYILNSSGTNSVWGSSHMICLVVWILSITMFGGYDRPIKLLSIIEGTLIGTALLYFSMPILQSFDPLTTEFLITGTLWALITFTFSRVALHLLNVDGYSLKANNKKRFLVVGSELESKRVSDLIWQINYGVGQINTLRSDGGSKDMNNSMSKIISQNKIDSVVFCAADVSDKNIIDLIQINKRAGMEYKIARPNCEYLIGSNTIESLQDLFILDLNSVEIPRNKRNKRALDIFLSIIFLLSTPISIWFVKNKASFLRKTTNVLKGKLTWIGYRNTKGSSTTDLPALKQAVLDPLIEVRPELLNDDLVRRINVIYAKDYSRSNDLKLVLKNFSKLGTYSTARVKV